MGVDFQLGCTHGGKSAADALERLNIPQIEARFAATEWPRFLAHLADGIGLGDLWHEHDQICADLSNEVLAPILADLAAGKHQGRRRRKLVRPAPPSPRVQELNAQLADWRQRAGALKPQHPLLHLMVAPDGVVAHAHCLAVAQSLAPLVETWPAAPEGYVGWRERGQELVAALRFAAAHPPLALFILA